MRSEYFVLLDKIDVVKYLLSQVSGLQDSITDLCIKDCIKDFVESDGFDRNKTPFDNKVEMLSYIAFKRHYLDRHPKNSNMCC